MLGVILYGPPASGKDTVTAALATLSPRYVHFPRLKVGGGATATYRMTTMDVLQRLRHQADLVWENDRYGATYAIDKPELIRALSSHVPIVHLGQTEAVRAVRAATAEARWLVAYLWCPREVAQRRLVDRGSTDVEARLRVWDETAPLSDADLALNTVHVSAAMAAHAIHARLMRPAAGPAPHAPPL